MATLGKNALIKELQTEDAEKRLYVTPLLSPHQIGESSIDIRLGNDFIVTRKGHLASIDPARQNIKEHRYQRKHCTNIGEQFFLHPNELVLASTLEYFRLPQHLSGYVTSRSSWGRAGLVIATATIIHPGFTGTITLELVNLGEAPLVLYPGLTIAQIVLNRCEGGAQYKGRFSNHTEARYGSVNEGDKSDLNFWTNKTNTE